MPFDPPEFMDNDGDVPAWLREDLASTPAEVLAWVDAEFGWDSATEADVSPPVPMTPVYGPHRDGEEHWIVCRADQGTARYWRID